MGLLVQRFDVPPGHVGVLYRDHRRERDLGPGVYRVFDPGRHVRVYTLSTAPQAFPVYAQEAITKDGVAFRFSYTVRFAVVDAERALAEVDLGSAVAPAYQVHELVHAYAQGAVKDRVAALTSEQIADERTVVSDLRTPTLDAQAEALGVRVVEVILRDVTFPRAVQRLFEKRLDAAVRAQADLENARTTVAAARALKNASALLSGDPAVLFLQYLETLTKIADKGSHTFHVEGVPALPPGASASAPRRTG